MCSNILSQLSCLNYHISYRTLSYFSRQLAIKSAAGGGHHRHSDYRLLWLCSWMWLIHWEISSNISGWHKEKSSCMIDWSVFWSSSSTVQTWPSWTHLFHRSLIRIFLKFLPDLALKLLFPLVVSFYCHSHLWALYRMPRFLKICTPRFTTQNLFWGVYPNGNDI